jgi:hypothetical protein
MKKFVQKENKTEIMLFGPVSKQKVNGRQMCFMITITTVNVSTRETVKREDDAVHDKN